MKGVGVEWERITFVGPFPFPKAKGRWAPWYHEHHTPLTYCLQLAIYPSHPCPSLCNDTLPRAKGEAVSPIPIAATELVPMPMLPSSSSPGKKNKIWILCFAYLIITNIRYKLYKHYKGTHIHHSSFLYEILNSYFPLYVTWHSKGMDAIHMHHISLQRQLDFD